tara:strand:- start:12320 stop:12559 length:240 start_codon:yes stop_codon:yes gene_type:complete
MKKLVIATSILGLLSYALLSNVFFHKINIFRREKQENSLRKDKLSNLKECIDIENSNRRKPKESIKLIEFCVKTILDEN